MISKASELAYDVYDVVSSNYNQGGGMLGGKSITADRLAIVKRLREMAAEEGVTQEFAIAVRKAAEDLESEIRAASGDER